MTSKEKPQRYIQYYSHLEWKGFSYKGSIKETYIRNHRPEDRCEVWDVEECRSVALDEPGYDRVAKEVEGYKSDKVHNDLDRWACGSFTELFILSEYYKGLKKSHHGPENTEESKIVKYITILLDQVFLEYVRPVYSFKTWKTYDANMNELISTIISPIKALESNLY